MGITLTLMVLIHRNRMHKSGNYRMHAGTFHEPLLCSGKNRRRVRREKTIFDRIVKNKVPQFNNILS